MYSSKKVDVVNMGIDNGLVDVHVHKDVKNEENPFKTKFSVIFKTYEGTRQ